MSGTKAFWLSGARPWKKKKFANVNDHIWQKALSSCLWQDTILIFFNIFRLEQLQRISNSEL